MDPAGRNRQNAEGVALLEWISSLSGSEKVSSLSNLADGHRIWEVLRGIDPNYFTGSLPEGRGSSGKWLSKWQNLKQISKSLTAYVTGECYQTIPNGPASGDLKLIAMEHNIGETIKAGFDRSFNSELNTAYTVQLLKLVLVAAINSPKSADYIGTLTTLSITSQESIKGIIEDVTMMEGVGTARGANYAQFQKPPHAETTVDYLQDEEAPLSPRLAQDQDLLMEERCGKLMADNEKATIDNKSLQKDLRDLHARLGRLQENNDVLQQRLIEAEDSLQQSSSAGGPQGESVIKELEIRIQRQEDLIATQEGQISDYQTTNEKLHRNAEKAKRTLEKSQSLQDELDETKAEKDVFAKKANTLDKYKQKLQLNQDLEKENQLLRGELEEIRHQYKDGEQADKHIAKLQLRVDEYERLLPKIEQDRHDLQMMKKQLEFDNATLAQRCESATEQHAKDQESIAYLIDKSNSTYSPRTSTSGLFGDFNIELEDSKKLEDELNMGLKAKSRTAIKASDEGSANCVELQQMLDADKSKYVELEKRYLETHQYNVVLESALEDVRKGHPIEGTIAFRKMRDQLKLEQQGREELEREMQVFRHQHWDDKNALSSVDKSKLEALEMLKEINSEELKDRRNEILLLHDRLRSMDVELDENKTMLRDALVQAKVLEGSELNKDNQDIKETLELIKAATVGRNTDADKPNSEALEQHISELANAISEARERLARRNEQIVIQDHKIQALRKKLERADNTTKAVLASQNPVLLKQELENVKRENKMMATAFHDLCTRLQMNNVTLQRRGDVPRSFLNRQRQFVNQATAVRSR